MSEPKFSKGPWGFEDRWLGPLMPGGVHAGPLYEVSDIITHDFGTDAKEQDAANLALIASAPELYEALDAIVSSLAAQDDEGLIEHAPQMAAARAALARARGETP